MGDLLYRLQGDSIVRCSQVSDNKELYASRLEGITSKWASPVADADGNVYFASAGKSYVLKAGPKFEVLGANDLEDVNHCSPAISGGRILPGGQEERVLHREKIMMTSHERFSRMFAHREADRIPIIDSPWGDTIARWHREGMPRAPATWTTSGWTRLWALALTQAPAGRANAWKRPTSTSST